MGPHVTPSGSRLPTAWVGPGANARPVLQAALGWGLHGEGGSCHGGGHPLSPSPVRERLALGALLAVRTPVTSLGTRNSAVWVHRSVLRASLGWGPRRRMPEARTWGALREPGPTWHTCPLWLSPAAASPERVPTVYLGKWNRSPAPPTHVKPLGLEPALGLQKAPADSSPSTEAAPGDVSPLHAMGVGWRQLAPLWALALALACAQHTGELPAGWRALAMARRPCSPTS